MTRLILAMVVVGLWAALPVYADEEAHNGEGAHHEIVEIMGICTFSLLLVTGITGLVMKRNRKVLLKAHKVLALVTVISAACHASLVVFL